MKKGIKILLIVLAVIAILAILLWVLYIWKKGKDIKDMKDGFSELLQSSKVDKETADKVSSCYIDKMVKEFGYLRAKEIYNASDKATSDEATKIALFLFECGLESNPFKMSRNRA